MTFTARVKRRSPPWTLWEAHHRLGGHLGGVAFRRVAPGEYVTGPLAKAEVDALRVHPHVEIEVATVPIPVEPFVAETPFSGQPVQDETQPPVLERAEDDTEDTRHTPGWRQRQRLREQRRQQTQGN